MKFNFAAFVKVFVLTAFLVTAVQTSAFAANTERLEIVNHTGRDIKAYYLVQASYKDWGPERLGNESFDNGQTVIFNYDPQFHYFKLQIVFTNNEKWDWENSNKIDFSDLWRLTIRRDGSGYSVKHN